MPEDDARAVDLGRRQALALVRWGGRVVIGGALAVAAVGVLAGSPTVMGLGLVVAAEESLEFAVLRGALRLRRLPPPTWHAPRVSVRM